MKALNKFVKFISYFIIFVWVFISLYLFALIFTTSVGGLIAGIFSMYSKSVPLVIQKYLGLAEVISAIPLTIIMYIVSYISAVKQSKQIINKIK